MTLTPAQRAALRRQRQRETEAEQVAAEARLSDYIGELFGLAFTPEEALPPVVQVGWRDVGGVAVLCLQCYGLAPPPTIHVPVYDTSYHATQLCHRCHRRLDDRS